MPVTDVRKDPDRLTMAITATFDAPVDRVWQLWADPRQLERWWGPPGYPATVVDHQLVAGGVVTYHMTSPDGERYPGWWRVLEVEAPRALRCQDGFGEGPTDPQPDMPTSTMAVDLSDRPGGGTVMVIETVFPSLQAMEQTLEMGAEEGINLAIGQIDPLLAEDPATAD